MAAVQAPTALAHRLPDPAVPGRTGAGRPAQPSPSSRRGRQRRWRRALVLGTVVLAVLASVFSAYADPSPSPGPAPAPTTSAEPTPTPSEPPSSCPGSDCIPQPSTSASPAPTAGTMPPAEVADGDGAGGISGWIAKGISSAITGFFKSVIEFALNPLLDLISGTLLTTPSPASLPRVGELWTNSWQIALACYALLVAIAGVVVMSHETVQARYSIKEIAPRIPFGFLAAALSLFLAGKAVDLANGLSQTAMGGGVNADTAGPALRDFVLSSFNSDSGSIFLVLMWLVVIGVLVALLLTYVVRVALTIILIVAAPLALICHALPQTDGIAQWWWKAFGGVLAIQVAQSLALITGVRVFLTPGGFGPQGLFGLTDNGLVNTLITLALLYVVFKIPFWIFGSIRFGNGRSFVGSVARAYVMYKTLGLLRGGGAAGAASRGGAGRTPPSAGPGGTSRSPRPSGPRPSLGSAGRRGGPNPSPSGPGRPAGGARRPPGPPLFLQPIPPASEGDRPIGPAAGPPPAPEFRAPGDPRPGASPAPPSARPAHPPGLPVFQAPSSTRPSHPARATGTTSAVPARPRFQQPTPQPHIPPGQTTRPPAPATFRPPVPEPRATPMRHPRTGASPPAVFSSPSSTPPPTRRTPPPPPRRRTDDTRSGGAPS
ncbi:hypothetical protein ACFPH6_05410 [Streptomyces xiangluensis]|uniref:TrbL/VirB6 plasmid conjugal transfer protein n=1 Tax=Streptomyces xiangluensis TaxID=2665720 RepID=A0ABV8YGZ4_9ACTN